VWAQLKLILPRPKPRGSQQQDVDKITITADLTAMVGSMKSRNPLNNCLVSAALTQAEKRSE